MIVFMSTAAVLSAILSMMSHEHRNQSKPTELKKKEKAANTSYKPE